MISKKFAAGKYLFLSILAFSSWNPTDAQDIKMTRSQIGVPVEVTPGQEFYAESLGREVPAYRLERPFNSSMGGSMGFPFSFSIDSDLLIRTRTASNGWEYYVPVDGRFSASHGLLGSVLADGDSVGLRIHPNGKQEWFVDNSKHNGFETIWSRKTKKKDPGFSKIMTDAVVTPGADIDRLIYLGVADGVAKIRHEQIRPSGSTIRDEFTFPVNQSGEGIGAIRGAEFIMKAGPLRALITVKTEMTSGIGTPVTSIPK